MITAGGDLHHTLRTLIALTMKATPRFWQRRSIGANYPGSRAVDQSLVGSDRALRVHVDERRPVPLLMRRVAKRSADGFQQSLNLCLRDPPFGGLLRALGRPDPLRWERAGLPVSFARLRFTQPRRARSLLVDASSASTRRRTAQGHPAGFQHSLDLCITHTHERAASAPSFLLHECQCRTLTGGTCP
jgi:hypothetical protein